MNYYFLNIFYLAESGENFRNHPYVRPVIESYYSMRDSEYLQPLRDFHRDVTNHMDRMRTSYNNAYRLTYRKMSELFDTEEMRKIQEWGQDLVNHVSCRNVSRITNWYLIGLKYIKLKTKIVSENP